jgi:hypothetical protein
MKANGDLSSDADPNALAYTLLTSMQGGMLLTQTLRITEPPRRPSPPPMPGSHHFASNPAEALAPYGSETVRRACQKWDLRASGTGAQVVTAATRDDRSCMICG